MKERLYVITKQMPDGKSARILLAFAVATTVLVGGALGAYAMADANESPVLTAAEIDLNRNGISEKLDVIWDEDGMRCEMTVTESGQVIFSEEAYTAHMGWNALFLYRGEYLLRYTPMMFQGSSDYRYKLFYLAEDGSEITVKENSVSFDTNFFSPNHSFDPQAIDAFLSEVNALLADSTLLINTDGCHFTADGYRIWADYLRRHRIDKTRYFYSRDAEAR